MSILQDKSLDVVNNSSTSTEAFVETREYTGQVFFYGLSKTNPNSNAVIVVDRVIAPLNFNTKVIEGLSIATGGGNMNGVFALWTPLTNVDDEGNSLGADDNGKAIVRALFKYPKQKSLFMSKIERGMNVGQMFNLMIDMNDPLLDEDENPGGMYWCKSKQ
tara:strand:- start:334 stop:816 length:483 start_codon:yes stop_codon:yes gene_type:complete